MHCYFLALQDARALKYMSEATVFGCGFIYFLFFSVGGVEGRNN